MPVKSDGAENEVEDIELGSGPSGIRVGSAPSGY